MRSPRHARWIALSARACAAISTATCIRTGVEFTSVSAAATSGSSNTVLPNQHGEKAQSPYEVAGAAYLQPNSYMLLNVGGVAYQGRATPTGTMLSLGFDWAQLDIGWRDHWWSPMTDSAMLISTEAPTMPSITLSNYRPLTRLGFQYETFIARMSESDRIELPLTGSTPEFTRGYPKFGGIRVGIEPVSGWALSAQRVVIWGGGAAGGQSFTDILKAMFRPGAGANHWIWHRLGHRQAGSLIDQPVHLPGARALLCLFRVRRQRYAGGTLASHRQARHLRGNRLSAHRPVQPDVRDLLVRAHLVRAHRQPVPRPGYLDGITNYGDNLGNWFGDQRVLATPNTIADQVGGQSNMLRLGWEPSFGGLMQLQLRALANEADTLFTPTRTRTSTSSR